jgi:hypothetical protein
VGCFLAVLLSMTKTGLYETPLSGEAMHRSSRAARLPQASGSTRCANTKGETRAVGTRSAHLQTAKQLIHPHDQVQRCGRLTHVPVQHHNGLRTRYLAGP